MISNGVKRVAAIALLSLTVGAGLDLRALACGGFFCNRNPIDQSGEKILFVRDDQTLHAIVQVQYQGTAEDFSWVVPVPGRPRFGVATNELFTRLEPATQARVQLDLRNDDSCGRFPPLMAAPTSFADGMESSRSGVQVLEEGTVGPYDYKILEATEAGELSKWLADNRYVLPDRFAEVTTTYLKPGYTFVAVKLTQKAGAGDIAPVILSYPTALPCVPLILTSIAARPDMPVTVYLAGPGRAVPINYKHVRINEARLDWLGRGANYNQLVTEAIDEAGGRAFVTDYATGSAEVLSALTDRYDVEAIRTCKTAEEVRNKVLDQGFSIDDQFRRIAVSYGVDLPVFRGGPGPVSFPDPGSTGTPEFDPSRVGALADEIQAKIVQPLRDVRGWMARAPYVTRLYTTMSPSEMTVDPEIDYHLGSPDFPDVSNLHRASGVRLCGEGQEFVSAPIEVTLPDGLIFRIPGGGGFLTMPSIGSNPVVLPAAAIIEQLNTLDAGKIETDNRKRIQALLAGLADPDPSGPAAGVPAPERKLPGASAAGPGCACAIPSATRSDPLEGSSEAGLGMLVGMVGWWRARRGDRHGGRHG